MLVGREAEQRELDSLLDSARNERSAVLLLRGEAGIGKTALLEYAQEQADDMKVLRCVGIEAEHELPFAGMHQLVRPCTALIDRLPDPQALALGRALGLRSEGVEDRFLVSLGLLSLLAEACDDGPLLCCIDDAQWLDGPSAEALVFAARRLEAEPIAMLMAVREGDLRSFAAPGVRELEVRALADDAAERLLGERLDTHASPAVVASLLSTANGNPLALLELPAALSAQQLGGAEPILGPPPVRPAVEDSFRARVEELPDHTRRLLLLAAADEAGDLGAIAQAAERLGLDSAELEAAERRGLVRLDGSVAFRHPLVRSVVYRSARREDRKAAHEALADVVSDSARRAWHRALVAERADEGVAAELEAAGFEAAARGAQATACAAFERAAELSPDPARRGHRLAFAAQASLDAARPDAAMALVERAAAFVEDPQDAMQLDMVRAQFAGRRGSPADSLALLRKAGARIARVAPEEASELVAWSVFVSITVGQLEAGVAEGKRAIEMIGSSGPLGRFARTFIDGAAALFAGDAATAGDLLQDTLEIGRELRTGRPMLLKAFVHAFTGDYARSREVTADVIAQARAKGKLGGEVGSFPLLIIAELGEGRLAAAASSVAEGIDLAEQLGFDNDVTACLALRARVAARQGREAACRTDAEAAMRRSLAVGLLWASEQARLAFAELELALGNPAEALEHYEQLDPAPVPPVAPLAAPDVIDAALRLGDAARAQAALDYFAAWVPVTRAPVVKGMLGRCRALLTEDAGEADRLFREALGHHGPGTPVWERARTQLAYGERLRRDRRKTEARAQLRNAVDAFEGLGAAPWAERARGELQATGETARKRDVSTLDELTPQELRIARLVAGGGSNREVAAQLFVSPKTVEYHLRKVFLKLGVSSRVELARAPLGEPPAEAAPSPH
jgi:DNA-binding CsgD family transcriptional regulator/tetratricopeptide (TPR) repeat protein